jgi:hypothetical protein
MAISSSVRYQLRHFVCYRSKISPNFISQLTFQFLNLFDLGRENQSGFPLADLNSFRLMYIK